MRPSNRSKKNWFLQILVLSLLLPGTVSLSLAAGPLSSPEKNTAQEKAPEKQNAAKGRYMAFFSLGMLPGSTDIIQTTPISLGMSHGYYTNGIYIGGGMAVENFEPAFLPVFADLRLIMNRHGKVQPWIKTILGKTFLFPGSSGQEWEKTKGKIVTGVGAGLSYPVSSRNAFYFYLGYRFMKYTEEYTGNPQNPVTNDYRFNRMEFRVGLSF